MSLVVQSLPLPDPPLVLVEAELELDMPGMTRGIFHGVDGFEVLVIAGLVSL